MKTLLAKGDGTFAIFEGDDDSILNDLYANLDKFYFHSELDYLAHLTTVTGSVSLPGSQYVDSSRETVHQIGSIALSEELTPICLFKINGVDTPGHRILQYTQSSSYITSFRLAGGYTAHSGGNLQIGLYHYVYGITGSTSVSVSVDVYTRVLNDRTEGILIQPADCVFAAGKFQIGKKYLHQKAGGFKLPNNRTIAYSGAKFFQQSPTEYIEVGQ